MHISYVLTDSQNGQTRLSHSQYYRSHVRDVATYAMSKSTHGLTCLVCTANTPWTVKSRLPRATSVHTVIRLQRLSVNYVCKGHRAVISGYRIGLVDIADYVPVLEMGIEPNRTRSLGSVFGSHSHCDGLLTKSLCRRQSGESAGVIGWCTDILFLSGYNYFRFPAWLWRHLSYLISTYSTWCRFSFHWVHGHLKSLTGN